MPKPQRLKASIISRFTVRAAHDRTGIAAADFSRIRNADLGRFTVDRLMSIINRLGSRVEVKVRVRPKQSGRKSAREGRGSGKARFSHCQLALAGEGERRRIKFIFRLPEPLDQIGKWSEGK